VMSWRCVLHNNFNGKFDELNRGVDFFVETFGITRLCAYID